MFLIRLAAEAGSRPGHLRHFVHRCQLDRNA